MRAPDFFVKKRMPVVAKLPCTLEPDFGDGADDGNVANSS